MDAELVEELEEGEVSDCDSPSETDAALVPDRASMVLTPPPPPRVPPPGPSLAASRYRSVVASYSSGDESSGDSDDDGHDNVCKRRRLQVLGNPHGQATSPAAAAASWPSNVTSKKKVNNIWGGVLQEQRQDGLANVLGILGMEGDFSLQSRQSESYNYLLAQSIMAKEREEEIQKLEADDGQMQEEMSNGTSDADFGMNHVPDESGPAKRKRRPVKERLGERKEMDFEGNFELKEDDSTGKVVSEIAHRLREPKKTLIERVVKCVGVRKSLELLSETVEIEKHGGMMILNGTRRRTPGGVYLNLLKSTPSITQQQIKEIFYEENQRDYNDRKLAVRRRRNVLAQRMKHAIRGLELHDAEDEASQETFASDTAEAQLEALEDPNGRDVHAPPTPQPPPSPAAPDAVDCLELETTNDLDLF